MYCTRWSIYSMDRAVANGRCMVIFTPCFTPPSLSCKYSYVQRYFQARTLAPRVDSSPHPPRLCVKAEDPGPFTHGDGVWTNREWSGH